MNKTHNSFLVKIIGLVCTLALVLGAIYVPVSLSAFAATIPVTPDETITFGFEPAERPIEGVGDLPLNDTRGGDGLGVSGWATQVTTLSDYDGRVLGFKWPEAWANFGGYRLNNNSGVYRLDPNTTYVVKLKISLRGATASQSYLALGYGFSGTTGSGNRVTEMSNIISNIAVSGSGAWTLSDISGTKVVESGNKWYDLTYMFTTPASFSGDNSLGFYTRHFQNFEFYMDNVQVTKLGSNTGVVLTNDDYNGEATVMFGNIGDDVELPTLVGNQEGHEFLGWFTDEERTVPAENLKYTKDAQSVYTKWRAPVTVTFKDTLNNTEVPVSGYTGDAIAYPAEPVDPSDPDQKFFGGWYTTESLTQKFEEEKFGSTDLTVYSKWVDKIEGFVQDFENYPYSDRVASAPDSSGNVVYENRHIFGEGMEKIADPTNSGRGNVIKYEWDCTMKKVPADPATYEAVGSGWDNSVYHRITMGTQEFVNGMQYIMYFDYYVESLDASAVIMTARNMNGTWGWTAGDYLDGNKYSVTFNHCDGKWHKGSITFTMKEKSGVGPNIHLFFKIAENNNAKVYLDNFSFVPVQANQVIMAVDKQDGECVEYIPVTKGAPITLETPTLADREFRGWYANANYSTRFEETVAPAKNFEVFAKWSPIPENFQKYPFNTKDINIFGETMSIVKGKGVGVNDDAALKFTIDADAVWYIDDNGNPVYWIARAGYDKPGHEAKLGTVEDGAAYKVSFWYKGDPNSNYGVRIRLHTASPNTFWASGKADTNFVVAESTTDWTKAEYIFYADLADAGGTGLYFRFDTTGGSTNMDLFAAAYVDDFLIEKIDKPFVIFDGQNGKPGVIVSGKAGEKVVLPDNPYKASMKFVGWYYDKEFTQPLGDTVLDEDTTLTVYAKYECADSFTVNFENVGINRAGKDVDGLFFGGGMGAVAKTGYKNSTGLFFDRTNTTQWASTNALFDDSNYIFISPENKYYVTFKYCVTEQQKDNGFLRFRTAAPGSSWAWKHSKAEMEDPGLITIQYPVPATAEVGKWYTGAMIFDTSKVYVHTNEDGTKADPLAYAAVYMYYIGGAGKIAVDDITFKKLPKGHQVYVVDNGGANSVPSYVSGPIGTSFRRQLPTNPQFENHIFKNYFRYDKSHNQAVLEDKDMVFTKDQISLVTNWVRLHTVQDFEDYKKFKEAYGGYGPADFDYELYDAKAEGNSADNVTSGRYSIHRLGNSAYFENIQILPDDLRICADEKFTVTMKVKVGKHFHTDGAIKIVGCKSSTYAWATSGSFHPIAPIADIADGQWHEVSYTFSSVERYLAIQTPGYVEIFIDDVVIDRADPEMPVSTPASYTEYVQALRDANGNLINVDANSIDVGSIIDFSLYIGGFNVLPVIIIVGAVILVAAAVFVVLFVIKKRKAKKA